jgi:amphi-Trp domain-containing protein
MAAMDLVEIKQRDRVHREQVARLRELADKLSRHNDIQFERDGVTFKVRVPDEVELKVELEIEDDGSEPRDRAHLVGRLSKACTVIWAALVPMSPPSSTSPGKWTPVWTRE